MTSNEQAIELVRRYANLGQTRNLNEIDEIFTKDFIEHSALGTQKGVGKLKDFVLEVWDWMPDIEVSVDSIFANQGVDGEPWVGAFVTLRGTTSENMRRTEMQEVWIFRFRDSKISERWSVYDETEPVAS